MFCFSPEGRFVAQATEEGVLAISEIAEVARRLKRVKPKIGTGTVRVVGSSPHKGNAEILKAEKLKSGPGIEAGIAQQGAAYYPTVMTTISLKLPENLLARLERESRARCATKSSVLRECLTETI
jgi:hypothetical protein